MFTNCEFIVGDMGMVIVLPGKLPADAPNYTVGASPDRIWIRAGHEEIAKFPYSNSEVFNRLSGLSQVGIVEFEKDEAFPGCITAVAYVETRVS